MTWALRDAPGVEHLIGYESELNRVTSSSPVVVLCLYDLDLFSGEVVVNSSRRIRRSLSRASWWRTRTTSRPDDFLRSVGA